MLFQYRCKCPAYGFYLWQFWHIDPLLFRLPRHSVMMRGIKMLSTPFRILLRAVIEETSAVN